MRKTDRNGEKTERQKEKKRYKEIDTEDKYRQRDGKTVWEDSERKKK